MSGGSLDYGFTKIDELADKIERYHNTPKQVAFARFLRRVAKAVHDIEWVISDDYCAGDEEKAIDDCMPKQEYIFSVMQDARKAMCDLKNAILEAEKTTEMRSK